MESDSTGVKQKNSLHLLCFSKQKKEIFRFLNCESLMREKLVKKKAKNSFKWSLGSLEGWIYLKLILCHFHDLLHVIKRTQNCNIDTLRTLHKYIYPYFWSIRLIFCSPSQCRQATIRYSCHLPWWSLSLFLSNNDDPTEKWRTADQVIIEDWNISKWFWEKKPWLSRANCEVVLALNQSELWFPDGMRLIVDFMAVFQYRWL